MGIKYRKLRKILGNKYNKLETNQCKPKEHKVKLRNSYQS